MRPNVQRIDTYGADASAGRVVIAPAKALWNGLMVASALLFAPGTLGLDALLVFLVTTFVTLLLGHSVGMHRRLIHLSYDCAKWLERVPLKNAPIPRRVTAQYRERLRTGVCPSLSRGPHRGET
jgi:hypothetical protein